MIWAAVSSWSCFCWLYRAFPSSTAKNIINLISVLNIWWCPRVESSLVLLEEGVCCDQCALLPKLCYPLSCLTLYFKAKLVCYSRCSRFKICNIVLLTIITMLHATFPWLTYFIMGNVYVLILFSFLTHTNPTPILTITNLLSVSMTFFFWFSITHVSEIPKYLSFFWLISLSIKPSRSISINKNGKISLFGGGMVVNIYILHFLCPFICWLTPR